MTQITVKISEILAINEVLTKFKSKQLPIENAFRMARLCKIFHQEVETYLEVVRELIEKYGERDENGELKKPSPDNPNTIPVAPEHMEQCQKDLDNLNKTEISLKVPLIEWKDLLAIDEATPTDLLVLEKIIDIKED